MIPARFILLLFASIFSCHVLLSQQIYHGLVTGRGGQPLAGASVLNTTTKKGTISDSSGRYSIPGAPGVVLEVSCIGYLGQQVTLKNESELIIQLSESQDNLNEVVRIGYGTTLRKDVTGAVSGISANHFNAGIITNPLQEIEGKVAGVVIVQPGGDPNGDYIVRIRGATSLTGQPPLLVIDGVAVDSFQIAMNTLNPADVESFTILKDASSAAIYGSRGANGVILVTTKRGRPGKTMVEYNGFVSAEKVSHELDALNADQWRKVSTGDPDSSSLDLGANTDWQKAITRTAFTQSHSLSISGGTNQLSYRGSVGYIGQQGVAINSGKTMVTVRLNIDQKTLGDKLDIRYGLSGTVTNRNLLPDQVSTNQAVGGGSAIFFYPNNIMLPVWPEYKHDGSYFQPPGNVSPLFFLNEFYSKLKESFFQGSFKADYEIVKGLHVGVLGGLSEGENTYNHFNPAIPSLGAISYATKSNNNKEDFTGDIHANYQKSLGKQSIDITGVYEYNKFENDGFAVNARGFLVPDLLNNNLGAATSVQTNDISSYKNEVVLISFLGRLVYAYDNRYILTASFRRDGSSKFGPENAWGNFPSLALAWRASNEEFLKRVEWISNLKFRVSYGYTGNSENLPPNKYQVLYSPGPPYLNNNTIYTSYSATQEYNPDLKWEVRKSFDIGMDFAVLKDRISGTIDVFNDKTSDMLYLYDLPQPPFQNPQVYANAANAVNKGIEISLQAVVIRSKTFSWEVQGNLSTVKNYITQLLGQFRGAGLSLSNTGFGTAFGGAFGQTYVTQLHPGYPAGVFWIPQHAGFDQNKNELFNKYSSQGRFTGVATSFTDTDRVYINPTPKYTWGFTSSFTLGNFDLSFLLRGVEGQKIFANSLLNLGSTALLPGRNVVKEALTDGFSQLPMASTFWLRDGSFIRCENLTLGYNFKNLKGINRLRLYVVVTNLFVITKYAGVDPEVSIDGNQRYIDATYYPKSRGFTFGVNFGF
jgi:TonB-linked SusC/RagA family outer membrane protein